MEPEIVKAGDNYELLKSKYGKEYSWLELTPDQLADDWRSSKSSVMLRLCHDLSHGELPTFVMPQHIQAILDFMGTVDSEMVVSTARVNNIPIVSTIESIKGQEGNSCLFILTTDLAAYLFGEKTVENKTKNKLYVALTRSLNALTILVTQEVENKYGADYIQNHVSMLLQD